MPHDKTKIPPLTIKGLGLDLGLGLFELWLASKLDFNDTRHSTLANNAGELLQGLGYNPRKSVCYSIASLALREYKRLKRKEYRKAQALWEDISA